MGDIRPNDNPEFTYTILAVGGLMTDLDDVQKHFYQGPEPPPGIDFDGDGVPDTFDGSGDDGMMVTPEPDPNGFKPVEMPDPSRDSTDAAMEHNMSEFKKAAVFAKENGLTAVMVTTDPGSLMVDLHGPPEIIYLDEDGNQVQADDAPELDLKDPSGVDFVGISPSPDQDEPDLKGLDIFKKDDPGLSTQNPELSVTEQAALEEALAEMEKEEPMEPLNKGTLEPFEEGLNGQVFESEILPPNGAEAIDENWESGLMTQFDHQLGHSGGLDVVVPGEVSGMEIETPSDDLVQGLSR